MAYCFYFSKILDFTNSSNSSNSSNPSNSSNKKGLLPN